MKVEPSASTSGLPGSWTQVRPSIPPALDELTCNTVAAFGQDPAVYLYNESYLSPLTTSHLSSIPNRKLSKTAARMSGIFIQLHHYDMATAPANNITSWVHHRATLPLVLLTGPAGRRPRELRS